MRGLPAEEVDHVDEIVDVAVTLGAAFGKLDPVVDAFQDAVAEAGLDAVDDVLPMRLHGLGELHEGRNLDRPYLCVPGIERVLRRYFVQLWNNFSDEGTEDAPCDCRCWRVSSVST